MVFDVLVWVWGFACVGYLLCLFCLAYRFVGLMACLVLAGLYFVILCFDFLFGLLILGWLLLYGLVLVGFAFGWLCLACCILLFWCGVCLRL